MLSLNLCMWEKANIYVGPLSNFVFSRNIAIEKTISDENTVDYLWMRSQPYFRPIRA